MIVEIKTNTNEITGEKNKSKQIVSWWEQRKRPLKNSSHCKLCDVQSRWNSRWVKKETNYEQNMYTEEMLRQQTEHNNNA